MWSDSSSRRPESPYASMSASHLLIFVIIIIISLWEGRKNNICRPGYINNIPVLARLNFPGFVNYPGDVSAHAR